MTRSAPVLAPPPTALRLVPPARTPGPDDLRLPLDTLTDIACGLARATDLWAPHARHDADDRAAVRLVSSEAYEVWLLGWTPGQHVELHDHGGSNGVFVVLEGELTEVTLGWAGTTTRRHRAGDVGRVPAGTVHDVLDDGAAPATSLHVYSPPLASMTYYDEGGAVTRSEPVIPEPAVLGVPPATRALHPASGPP